MPKLYFITTNKDKFAEVQALIPEVEQLSIALTEIQDADPHVIIKAKLKEAAAHNRGAYIVDDTSLSFDALNGLPGPFIKWFLEKLGREGLADTVHKLGNNKATAKAIIGYAKGDDLRFFEGTVAGTIVSPRGNTFGWDPIFVPDGYSKTFAEMGTEEKNRISHRTQAVRKLKEYLASR